MKAGFNKIRLDELTEDCSPITYGVVKPGDMGDVPLVRGGDISNGKILESQLRTITADVSEQYKRTLLRGGELLMCLVGQPGQVAVVPDSLAGANIARQVGLIRLRDGIDAEYISYFLQSPDGQESLGAHTGGSVQQVINLGDLRTVEVPVPSQSEQQRIVTLLDEAFDGIATARANAEQNLQNARALFESHLQSVFSQAGEGWMDRKLGDIFHIGSSKRVYENEWTSSGVPFYGGREIVKLAMGEPQLVSAAHISEEKYCELASQYDMPQEGNILMTARGTIGVGYVVKSGDKFYYKDGNIISFREKIPTNPWFILFAFRTQLIRDQIGDLTGATVKHLPIEKANALSIKLPDFYAQNILVKDLERIEAETQRLDSIYQRKLAALDALKKSLLHQAFSGEL